ncbi:MAG TPA: sigma-70 family RNA polymerase sigma factor [Polyangia bacterium]|jgi:RNA polymerase sigma-70 factor (ECF subfamily)|nr:sigma-70 family RNA polymerase sigma factor [Polyangia bacterium]
MENLDSTDGRQPAGTKAPQGHEANPLRDLDEVIASACAGDRAALNRLLTDARPRLLAVAMRIVRDRDDAEDVVQEALLKVCRSLTHFERRSAFSTWLHRIVVNAALDRLRRHQARRDRVADDDDERAQDVVDGVDEQTPERVVSRRETGAAVRGALARLSTAHREVLELRELEGESYRDLARLVQCPVGTVMSRLHHARHRLAAELAPAVASGALRAA